MSSDNEEGEKRNPLDLLYDPKSDDRDTNWATKLRKGKSSDAVLSCPCCFSTLCLDCQQHISRPNQYRAMFVMNCKVKLEQKRYPIKRHRDKETYLDESDECFAVCCRMCDVEVAIYDQEGIYHFFDVLPSQA